MTRPRLLDLFCGAGGAAMGYHRAGFDVVGVDNRPQPHYPFDRAEADALWAIDRLIAGADILGHKLADFDAIHASPPCQDHTRQYVPQSHETGWMLAATRERLKASGLPWVLENVPGAPMQPNLIICGCVVGLEDLERERWFETWPILFDLRQPCQHARPVISVSGTGTPTGTWKAYGSLPLSRFREVMGISWMARAELSQAIPPAYTEHIGTMLLKHLKECAA